MTRLDDGTTLQEPFDHQVIATGAMPLRPNLPGGDAKGVCGLAVLEDGIRVRRAVEVDQPATAVIVGGGYIGLEMAEAFDWMSFGKQARHSNEKAGTIRPVIQQIPPYPSSHLECACGIHGVVSVADRVRFLKATPSPRGESQEAIFEITRRGSDATSDNSARPASSAACADWKA